MFMQTVNRLDTERVWVTVNNTSGHTLTQHYPVFKYDTAANASSVSTNEAGLISDTCGAGSLEGNIIGLAFEDIPNGSETGVVQVYGYHESVLLYASVAVKVNPGTPLQAQRGNAASVGLTSIGAGVAANRIVGNQITALDTLTYTGPFPAYGNHVFIRAM